MKMHQCTPLRTQVPGHRETGGIDLGDSQSRAGLTTSDTRPGVHLTAGMNVPLMHVNPTERRQYISKLIYTRSMLAYFKAAPIAHTLLILISLQ
jgi:hypothetical protein